MLRYFPDGTLEALAFYRSLAVLPPVAWRSVAAIQSGVAQYNTIQANKDLVKKAQLVQSSLDWEKGDIGYGQDPGAPTDLPGATAAREYLEQLFAAERQGFVVLVKLTTLQMIEDRYGPGAVGEYVNNVIRVFLLSIGSKDRLFSWSREVLMLVIRRSMSPVAVRLELARLMQNRQHYISQLNGKRVMVAAPSAFDLLPISGFSSFEEMLAVFNAKLTGTL